MDNGLREFLPATRPSKAQHESDVHSTQLFLRMETSASWIERRTRWMFMTCLSVAVVGGVLGIINLLG